MGRDCQSECIECLVRLIEILVPTFTMLQ